MMNCLLVLLPVSIYTALLCSAQTEKPYSTKDPCPCDNPDWCQPLSNTAVQPRELYGFAHVATAMNWTHVTTVAWAGDDLTCRAHAHGVKSVLAAPKISPADLFELEARLRWAKDALQQVKDRFRDGIVFDYEGPVTNHPLWGYTYAKLISETYSFFKRDNPNYQVSVCVPWSPDDIDGRNYPWTMMQADIFYVMDYDTRSQIFDACIAGANAPFPGMISGMQRWEDIGMPVHKMVLGVPWYGYTYTCLDGTRLEDRFCPIQQVPFRGVNCSDAAGSEIPYDVLIRQRQERGATVRRDENTGAPFFNYQINGTVHQVWYDDPILLRRKYAWARDHGVLGVGPFTFDDLDTTEKEIGAEMWTVLDAFFTFDTKDDYSDVT